MMRIACLCANQSWLVDWESAVGDLQVKFTEHSEEARINTASPSTWQSHTTIQTAEAFCERAEKLVQARFINSMLSIECTRAGPRTTTD